MKASTADVALRSLSLLRLGAAAATARGGRIVRRRRCCSSFSASSAAPSQEQMLRCNSINGNAAVQQPAASALMHRRRRWYSSTRPVRTSAPPPPVDAPTVDDLLKSPPPRAPAATRTSPPKAVFPWRHESYENPVPRLVEGTEESRLYDLRIAPAGQAFIAYTFLNVPFWQTLLPGTSLLLAAAGTGFGDWRGDLAENFAYAFATGVAGIVTNVYDLSFDDVAVVDPDTDNEKVDFRYPPLVAENEENEVSNDNDEKSKDEKIKKEDAADDEKVEKSRPPPPDADAMLVRPLVELYRGAHEGGGRQQLQIRLEMEPRRALLRNLFCIPFLTRTTAETNPSQLKRMMTIMKAIRTDFQGGTTQLFDYMQEQIDAKGDRLETTVDAEVLVECDEIFQVLDKETGALLQGSADGNVRRVMHVVRFENTVTTTFR